MLKQSVGGLENQPCGAVSDFGVSCGVVEGTDKASTSSSADGDQVSAKARVASQPEKSAIERHVAMNWARRLKRVFGVDVESCVRCGKSVRVAAPAHRCARGIGASLHVIASIEESALIERILEHVRGKGENSEASLGPPSTGLPVSA